MKLIWSLVNVNKIIVNIPINGSRLCSQFEAVFYEYIYFTLADKNK